jgi:hypothetical protein
MDDSQYAEVRGLEAKGILEDICTKEHLIMLTLNRKSDSIESLLDHATATTNTKRR